MKMLCYYFVLCLVFREYTTIAFSLVVQHKHKHHHYPTNNIRYQHVLVSLTTTSATKGDDTLSGYNADADADADADGNGNDTAAAAATATSLPLPLLHVLQLQPLHRRYPSSRRSVISSTIAGFAGAITSGVVTPQLKRAFAASSVTTSAGTMGTADHPVVIVGANGRTGMAVAEAIANPKYGNMHAVTLTRSGNDPFRIIKLPETIKNNIRHRPEPFDVRDTQGSISSTLQELSPSVIVYAASASRQGGGAFEIDDVGVEKVAFACQQIGALFVLISALAVDRPNSQSYQITNTLGGKYNGIMDAKYNGENKTKKTMKGNNYVIIRPGVLMNQLSQKGPVGIELNQGDTIGGGISRDELAGIVVGAIQSQSSKSKLKKGSDGITIEAYRKNTATKLQPEFSIPSGNELTITDDGSSSKSYDLYQELFVNAKTDVEFDINRKN